MNKKQLVMCTEDFIKYANIKHNNLYDYSKTKYVTSKTRVVITCKVHGDFLQTPCNHLWGKGCAKCSAERIGKLKRKRVEEAFVEKAILMHGNKYDYSKVSYVGHKEKIIITCPIHGDFLQKADGHLSGRGCYKCANENRGFRRTDWVKRAGDRKGLLYVINCKNDTETFIKIGITLTGIKNRFPRGILMPYEYTILHSIEDNPYNIFNMEIKLKRELTGFKYSPLIFFDGSRLECFTMDSLTLIKEILNEQTKY